MRRRRGERSCLSHATDNIKNGGRGKGPRGAAVLVPLSTKKRKWQIVWHGCSSSTTIARYRYLAGRKIGARAPRAVGKVRPPAGVSGGPRRAPGGPPGANFFNIYFEVCVNIRTQNVSNPLVLSSCRRRGAGFLRMLCISQRNKDKMTINKGMSKQNRKSNIEMKKNWALIGAWF